MTKPNIVPSRTIIGKHVSNSWSEDLGKIEDLVFDLDNGCIKYAVLSFRGILGLGAKHFAIPWDRIGLPKKGSKNKNFSLNIDRDDLIHAPGFAPDNWPDMADSAWVADMERHYAEVITEPH